MGIKICKRYVHSAGPGHLKSFELGVKTITVLVFSSDLGVIWTHLGPIWGSLGGHLGPIGGFRKHVKTIGFEHMKPTRSHLGVIFGISLVIMTWIMLKVTWGSLWGSLGGHFGAPRTRSKRSPPGFNNRRLQQPRDAKKKKYPWY